MDGENLPRVLGTGSITLAGVSTLLVHLYHLIRESNVHAISLGVLIPLVLSILLVAAGVRLHREDFEHPFTIRVATWAAIGIVGGVAFGYPVVPYQAAHGITMVDTAYLLANWLTVGAVVGVLIGFYDARRRQYRQALEGERAEMVARERTLARKNERLERFANLLSHDLRNPLNVASGHAALAIETGNPDRLAPVVDALDRMEDIIDDMLVMAHEEGSIDDDDAEIVSLAEIARTSWKTFDTTTASLEIEGDVDFRADASRVRHIFENAYRNAIEHGGESVTIRVGVLESRSGFFIEDDGPGIPEDARDEVFEPAHSGSPDGTGYGLHIVESVARSHGWTVDLLESSTGGARFEFSGL